MNIPKNLSHKPIIGVEYEMKDASAHDAKYLSLGRATWAEGYKDYSAKVFRLINEGTEYERWSRQSEELPFWRVLDLAILVVAGIFNKKSYLNEELVESKRDLEEINAFFEAHYDEEYKHRLKELKRLLDENKNRI